jgi:serine/threonine-protein kinase
VVARFVGERQILASLSHPNIARLLDGGATDDGRPYLVMEHVEGRPIDRYCEERGLSIPERLRLFCVAGRAVQHAHRHLVIHRDLKPSNILVTEDGEVKLLDFGIAKLLDDAAGPAAPVMTRTGVRVMTPRFASPEQVRGEPVTTASDVYQLGLLLYELLTGRPPYRLAGLTPTSLERVVCEETPPPPSDAVASVEPAGRADAAALGRKLRGDLDTIVMTALRKEPDRRYASVEALVADVERHLKGQPVSARKDTLGYRTRKFVGRNRWAVAAAAGFVLLLAAYGATATVQARRVAAERDRAEAVKDFLVGVFTVADPEEGLGDTITARTLLARGADRLETELADRPALRAEMLEVIGEVHANLGLYNPAIPLLERAVELGRDAYGPDDPRLADAYIALGIAEQMRRDFEAAIPHYREALAIRRDRLAADDPRVGAAYALLGFALRDAGQPDSAEALFHQALRIYERDPGPDSHEYLDALHGLAYALRAQDRLDEAEPLYREVLDRQRRAGVPDQEVATTLNNLAYLLRVKEDYGAAAPLYREALRIRTDVYGRAHPATQITANNLAAALQLGQKPDDAFAVLAASIAALEERWPEGHWRIGSARRTLGVALARSGRHGDAEANVREALVIFEAQLGPENPWTAVTRAILGAYIAAQGRRAEAGPHLDRSLADLRSVLETRPLDQPERRQLSFLIGLLEEHGLEAQAARFRELES